MKKENVVENKELNIAGVIESKFKNLVKYLKNLKKQFIKMITKYHNDIQRIEKENKLTAFLIRLCIVAGIALSIVVLITYVIPVIIAFISYMLRLIVFIAMAVVLGFLALGTIHTICEMK